MAAGAFFGPFAARRTLGRARQLTCRGHRRADRALQQIVEKAKKSVDPWGGHLKGSAARASRYLARDGNCRLAPVSTNGQDLAGQIAELEQAGAPSIP